MKKNKKIEINAVKLKRVIQDEFYEKTKSMTPEQLRAFHKKEASTGSFLEFWKRIQAKTSKKR